MQRYEPEPVPDLIRETEMADRYDGSTAQGSGSCVSQRAVGEYPLLPPDGGIGSVNRLSELVLSLSKETRMQGLSRHSFSEGGWCGEGELKAPLYPIRPC